MNNGIFYVTSPLQILCAMEAEHYFNIKKAKYVFIIDEDSLCGRQMTKIAEDEGLSYTTIKKSNFRGNKLKSLWTLSLFFMFRIRPFSYEYVFVGDESENQMTLYSLLSLGKGGNLLYLDDGVSSVKYLSEGVSRPKTLRCTYNLLKKILSFKDKLYFTHYFSKKSPIYKIIPNKFEYLREKVRCNSEKGFTYILGTPIEQRAQRSQWMTPDSYKRSLECIIKLIKSNEGENSRIIYAPHRRENIDFVRDICTSNGVLCEFLDLPIEAYMVSNNITPKCVWGYKSSALYTLKILYPDVSMNNVYFENNDHDLLNEYYDLIGVKNWNNKQLVESIG